MIDCILATVIFVQDLDKCTAFYKDVFKLPFMGSDANSSSFKLRDSYLFLQSPVAAAGMLGTEPSEIKFGGSPRVVLAATVENVDAAYEELKAKGVTFLRPPTDQPWGMRTAHFADPEGNIWEINRPMPDNSQA